MRIQVFIRDDLAKVLHTLAWSENRWPKQQAEWLLQKALEQAAQDGPPHPDVTLHAKWRGFFHIIWRSAEASNGAAESQRTLPTRAASRQCVVPTHTLLQGVSLCQNRTFTVHFRQSCRPKSLI